MKRYCCLLFFLSYSIIANDHLIRSTSLSISKISSDSDLKDQSNNRILTFAPNVASGFGIGVETKYLSLAYFFAGEEADEKGFPKSKFLDLRLNFSFDHFDFRFNIQRYKGAIVNAALVKSYYDDYEVRGRNLRVHFYKNKDVLKYIRDGEATTKKAAINEGTDYFGSLFAGFNFDQRSINLPRALAPEHLSLITQKNINYSQNFDAFTFGPLLGYDYLVFKSIFFLRAKIAAGAGVQVGGKIVEMVELALNLGVGFYENHSLAISVDSYSISFRDDQETISNNNTQGGVIYNYAF